MPEPLAHTEPTERCQLCGRLYPVADARYLPVPGEPDWRVCPDCYHRTMREAEDEHV